MKKNLLIIDDEIGICTSVAFAMEDRFSVRVVTDAADGLRLLREEVFHLCLLDLRLGEYNGLDILQEIKRIDSSIIVIMMTAYGSIDTTVSAMKAGAFTYLTKPLDLNELYAAVEQALEFQQLNERVEYLSHELGRKYSHNGIVGKSPSMREVFGMIDKLKDIDSNVIVTGESGTGKELVARALHYSGKRRKERFEAVNCAAIPEGLLEEELFGHKKGAFTGAVQDKRGKFEMAAEGSILLDEIGDMPIALQAKLLRVLQEKEYTPIGSVERVQLNTRFIAATNQDLQQAVERGTFRQDLFYRLNVFRIDIPPLRERKQDLPLLFEHLIRIYNSEFNKNVQGFSKEAESRLLRYHYPGNVRELSKIIEYAVVMTDSDVIGMGDLPAEVRECRTGCCGEELQLGSLVGLPMKEVEKKVIVACLRSNGGQKKATAQMLEISEKGLHNKIKEYKITL